MLFFLNAVIKKLASSERFLESGFRSASFGVLDILLKLRSFSDHISRYANTAPRLLLVLSLLKKTTAFLNPTASSASTTQASANKVKGEKELYSVPPLFLEYTFNGSQILESTFKEEISL